MALLQPLLGDDAQQLPAWKSWLAHVRVFEMVMRFAFTLTDVASLDQLIVEHHTAFLNVPEYSNLWKPKHHFATHVTVDIFRYGPCRGYWCMAFEGFNRIVKDAALLSNFRAEDEFVIDHWIFKSAKRMHEELHNNWLHEYDDYD